jgi:hypothetical protein
MDVAREFHTFAIDFTCSLINPLAIVGGGEEASFEVGDDAPCLEGTGWYNENL